MTTRDDPTLREQIAEIVADACAEYFDNPSCTGELGEAAADRIIGILPPEPSDAFERVAMALDPGIRDVVRLLMEAGVETFESCEGGPGHAFPVPTVRFHGYPDEGWRALAIARSRGLNVTNLRRTWDVIDGEPTGPHWELVLAARREK